MTAKTLAERAIAAHQESVAVQQALAVKRNHETTANALRTVLGGKFDGAAIDEEGIAEVEGLRFQGRTDWAGDYLVLRNVCPVCRKETPVPPKIRTLEDIGAALTAVSATLSTSAWRHHEWHKSYTLDDQFRPEPATSLGDRLIALIRETLDTS